MPYKGASLYDNQDFFEKYIQKRQKGNTPNDLLEKPYIDILLGNVEGKYILDIGCGDGSYGKALLVKGAKFYHGIDGSQNMIRLAQQHLAQQNVLLDKKNIETFDFPIAAFDLIFSRLAFHYVKDLAPVFKGIYKSLKSEGIFVFSVEHPIITSCYEAYHQKEKRGNWIVDNYFKSGERINKWIGKEVVKYHRTIAEYFQLFEETGFKVVKVEESKPKKSNFTNQLEYERRNRIPLFMFFKLKKQ